MKASESRKVLRDYGAAVIFSVAIALFIRIFLLEAYRIPSPVMRPTLEPGDTIFVAKWPYRFSSAKLPSRGEIIVYAGKEEPKHDYIKRVIGLPGDVVSSRAGRITLNGKPLSTGPAGNDCTEERAVTTAYRVCREAPVLKDFGPETVPAGSLLVMGDLRSEGGGEARRDSAPKKKSWEIIPGGAVKGRALWIWLSIDPTSPDSWFSRIRFERMLRRIH